MHHVICALGAFAITVSACNLLDPSFSEPALIVFYGDTAQINAPDTVTHSTPFEISVQTFAGGCTRRVARTEQSVAGSFVEIRPYNETVRNDVCTDDLLILVHRATVRLDKPGAATIRVVAEQRPVGNVGRNGPAELTRTIMVR
jgi:hypothetical protein